LHDFNRIEPTLKTSFIISAFSISQGEKSAPVTYGTHIITTPMPSADNPIVRARNTPPAITDRALKLEPGDRQAEQKVNRGRNRQRKNDRDRDSRHRLKDDKSGKTRKVDEKMASKKRPPTSKSNRRRRTTRTNNA
jgi:hypothetical protein